MLTTRQVVLKAFIELSKSKREKNIDRKVKPQIKDSTMSATEIVGVVAGEKVGITLSTPSKSNNSLSTIFEFEDT